MSKTCLDCVYSKMQTTGALGEYRCTKTGKRFNSRKENPNACGQFRSDDDGSYSCWECEHFTNGIFGMRCAKTGNKVNEDDAACNKFIKS